MNKILIFAILILTISCIQKQKETKAEDTKVKTENYEQVYVSFLDKAVFIPKDFEAMTIDEYEDILLERSYTEQHREALLESMYRMKLLATDYMLFVDTLNSGASIWFNLTNYVEFDAAEATRYIGYLKRQIEQEAASNSEDVMITDKKFFKTKKSTIVKVKFFKTDYIFDIYTTQYIITTEGQTLSVLVMSPLIEDYEEVITLI